MTYSNRPWCGQCGGACFRMLEHFGEGDHFPAITGNCYRCGLQTMSRDHNGDFFCTGCRCPLLRSRKVSMLGAEQVLPKAANPNHIRLLEAEDE